MQDVVAEFSEIATDELRRHVVCNLWLILIFLLTLDGACGRALDSHLWSVVFAGS